MKKPTDQQMKMWLEAVWRDGFEKGVDGRGTGLVVPDDIPNFQDFDPRIKDGTCVKVDYSELAPFNTCKCAARTYKDGYPVQCSRSHQDGERFCKTHLDKYNKVCEQGLDLRFGHYDGERPTHWLDKVDGEKIGWYDTKKNKSRSSSTGTSNTKNKMKVGELREYLSTRLPNEHLRGLKKKELLELYEKEISSPHDSSDTETEPLDSPKNLQETDPETDPEPEPETESVKEPESAKVLEPETEPESVKEQEPETEPETDLEPEYKVEKSIEIVTNHNGSETEIHREKLIPVDVEESVVDSHEILIQELNSLKNSERKKRAKKSGATEEDMDAVDDADDSAQALIDLIISLECPKNPIKPVDPDSDEDELDEDKTNYEEITHDGVDYLEDEDSGNIYNIEFKHVGKWNENNDEIIWVNNDFRRIHEASCD